MMNTRAASANLANARMMHTIEEPGQMMAGLKGGPHLSHASQRSTLGDIGNQVSAITISDVPRKDPIKKEIVHISSHQQKILTRSKTTVSVKNVVEELHAQQQQEAFNFLEPVTIMPKSVVTASVPTATTVVTQPTVPVPMEIAESVPESFSRLMLKVQNIDANDKENPQLVSEYVNDIYDYMRDLEKKFPIQSNYLENQEITGKMRAILIDWLCQVHHRFHLLQETLYLTVAIIDRFLQENPVPKNKLQLVGVTSMLIASKYEEMYAPEVADFVYITDNAYTKKQILEMEQNILRGLKYSFGRPLCLHFLRRDSKAGQVDANKHTLAKYLMELTITEYDMVQYLPSKIAAAALCLSMKLLDNTPWTETLSHYSSYSEKELVPTMQKLASLVIKAEHSKLTAVHTKYSSSKFMKISKVAALKSPLLKELAHACS